MFSKVKGALTVFAKISPAGRYFLVMMTLGLLPLLWVGFASILNTLALLVMWTLLVFFLTTVRFAEWSRFQRVAFSVSFVGGYLMLGVSLWVLIIQPPALAYGSCGSEIFDVPLGLICGGNTVGFYYAAIDQMVLSSVVTVSACLFYATTYFRGSLFSGVVAILASWFFLSAAPSVNLPVPPIGLFLLTAVGGLLLVSEGWLRRGESVKSAFLGRIVKIFAKPVGITILLLVLIVGVAGGVWGYAGQAVGDLQLVCGRFLSSGPGFVSDVILGISNPSYLSVDTAWKISFDYTGPHLVLFDIESFNVPARGVAYPHFTFQGLDLQRGVMVNATYPLIISLEQHYSVLSWSFDRNSSVSFAPVGGVDFGLPAFGDFRPC